MDKKYDENKGILSKGGGENGLTELVMILDRSGSMEGLEKDTVGGFNSMIKKQRKTEGECLVSTVLFNHTSQVLYDRVPLSDVRKMTGTDYMVGGTTALLDAVGGAVSHIGNIHKYARKEDVPARTMFVITTDGMENSSHRYSLSEVRQMIKRQKEKYGWEFLFIGANMDAVEVAGGMGIDPDRAVEYYADEEGTGVLYDAVSDAVAHMRMSMPLRASWSKKIKKDRQSRKH